MAREDGDGRPILYGLLAFAGVTLAVGGVLGGAAWFGARATGLDGGTIQVENSATQSLYLPSPSPTETPTGPLVTISAGSAPAFPTPTGDPTGIGSQISLSVDGSSFSPGEKINLTGTYAAGEGVRLDVQRLEGSEWEDFADVTATVTDGTFGTYIYTERGGAAEFRVYDEDADRASNTVTFTVG